MSETAIKERPILFSQQMVRAILEGRKTQTRRTLDRNKQYGPFSFDDPRVARYCPYGQPGDRLWVREALAHAVSRQSLLEVSYKIDGVRIPDRKWQWMTKSVLHGMFMPRWAARLFLEITDVRVERLQDISEADVLAEGFELDTEYWCDNFRNYWNEINGNKYPWPRYEDPRIWVFVISFRVVQP